MTINYLLNKWLLLLTKLLYMVLMHVLNVEICTHTTVDDDSTAMHVKDILIKSLLLLL